MEMRQQGTLYFVLLRDAVVRSPAVRIPKGGAEDRQDSSSFLRLRLRRGRAIGHNDLHFLPAVAVEDHFGDIASEVVRTSLRDRDRCQRRGTTIPLCRQRAIQCQIHAILELLVRSIRHTTALVRL